MTPVHFHHILEKGQLTGLTDHKAITCGLKSGQTYNRHGICGTQVALSISPAKFDNFPAPLFMLADAFSRLDDILKHSKSQK